MYDFLLFLNLAVWLALTIFYVRQPFASVFHPVSFYLAFHFIVFAFRPIFAWYGDYNQIYRTYQFTPSINDKIVVQFGTILGLLCFVIPAMRFGNAPPRFPQDNFDNSERENLLRPFLLVTAIIAPIGFISALAHWDTRATESSTMIMDAATGHTINTTSNGYFDNFQIFLAPLSVMFAWLCRFRWWSLMPLAFFVVLRAGTGGRAPFVLACVAAALLFLYQQRRKWPNLRAIAIAAVGLAFFAPIGGDRGAAVRNLFIEDRSYITAFGNKPSELQFLEGMDFGNLEYFEFLVYAVPQRTGTYGFFLDNLQLITQPIPRVLWEGKPVGPPIQLFHLFDYGYPIGMTYSLPGNGWMQLGFVGIAIWRATFGWLFGTIYNLFQQSSHSNYFTVSYMIFLSLAIQFFRDGLLLVLVQISAFYLFPVCLIVKIARLSGVPMAVDLRRLAWRRRKRSGRPAR